jgi:hypothetical protein
MDPEWLENEICSRKNDWSVLPLLGSAGMVVILLAHFGEALQLFPWMHWGED